jgi:hypothetical protein
VGDGVGRRPTSIQPNAAGDSFTQDTNHAWAAPFTIVKVSSGAAGVAGGTFVNTAKSAITYAPTLGTSRS